jgi:diaminopimelate epimerase
VVCHQLGLCERQARLDLPGGPLWIHWDQASDHLFMTGPAEPVFDAVITPELWGDDAVEPGPAKTVEDDVARAVAPLPPAGSSKADSIDCSTACVNGCARPDACASAEARARVEALLQSSSLDDLVALATNSLESRTRARAERTGPFLL